MLRGFKARAQPFVLSGTIARSIHSAPVAPKVLRSCDMEYVMLHLVFSLPHAWGGTTRNIPLPLVSQIFLLLPVSFEINAHL